MSNKLIAGAVAAVLISTGQAAQACPRVERVTLPPVQVVQPYCEPGQVVWGHSHHDRVRHVHFELLGAYESPKGGEWLRYTIEAHTTSARYRWHKGKLGHGWHRFTRRTATFTYDVRDLPDCVFDGENP